MEIVSKRQSCNAYDWFCALWGRCFGHALCILQPVLSISYILSLVLAVLVLGESVGIFKILGTGAIMIGLILITRGET